MHILVITLLSFKRMFIIQNFKQNYFIFILEVRLLVLPLKYSITSDHLPCFIAVMPVQQGVQTVVLLHQ
jgi:hypothetical protein